jgi:hypothetical protein
MLFIYFPLTFPPKADPPMAEILSPEGRGEFFPLPFGEMRMHASQGQGEGDLVFLRIQSASFAFVLTTLLEMTQRQILLEKP